MVYLPVQRDSSGGFVRQISRMPTPTPQKRTPAIPSPNTTPPMIRDSKERPTGIFPPQNIVSREVGREGQSCLSHPA